LELRLLNKNTHAPTHRVCNEVEVRKGDLLVVGIF
jgi:hypothetical protein